jgi:hypothetical protein
MGISAKVAVAGAAGLFGIVIAAGGAIAASGATLVADAPGTTLQVQGIGAAPAAASIGTNARLKLLAAAEFNGTVETVFSSTAIALGGPATSDEQTATDAGSNVVDSTPNSSTHEAGTGNDGVSGNGNTNNGKGNNGVSGNGNTDNGHGNVGNNGNSGTPGNVNTNNGNGAVSGNGNSGTPGNMNTDHGNSGDHVKGQG